MSMHKLLAILLAAVFLIGCNQKTNTPVKQVADQKLVTPVATDQETAQGAYITVDGRVYILNAHGRGATEVDGELSQLDDKGNPVTKTLQNATSSRDASGLVGTDAGYAQGGLTIANVYTITTGGTSSEQGADASGSGSQGQTPGSNQNVDPTQDVRPRTAVDLNTAITPGGIANQNAAAGAGEGNVGADQTNDNDLRHQMLKAIASDPAPFIDLFQGLLQPAVPNSDPPPPPSPQAAANAAATLAGIGAMEVTLDDVVERLQKDPNFREAVKKQLWPGRNESVPNSSKRSGS